MLKNEKYLDVRIVKSRKKIKKAMIQLMSRENYSAITINDIVKYADVNRGTFYNHYDSKEELLNEIMDEIVSDLVDSYRLPYLDIKKFKLTDISPNTVVLFQNVYTHKDFYRMIVQSDIIYIFQTKLTKALINMNELHFTNPDINREIITVYHSSALVGSIIHWVEKGFIYAPEYMAEQLIGIITLPSDHSLINIKEK